MADKVVKIDAELLEEVEQFISSKKNKFKYVNRKQFIDIAVSEYLHKEKKKVYRLVYSENVRGKKNG